MTQIKVINLGRKDSTQLFAVGNKQGEYYFIAPPPKNTAEREFFDSIYTKVRKGESVFVEATLLNGRNAQLVTHSELEKRVEAIELPVTTPLQYDDSVQAQIVQLDLYSIIHDTKESHFGIYGKHCEWDYEKKMEALKQGKPQQRLQEDRLSREIVRLLLATGEETLLNEHNFIFGRKRVEFPNGNYSLLNERAYDLMHEGLLDFTFHMCGPNQYAFESEFIVQPSLHSKGMMTSEYRPNGVLREALTKMLMPFSAEKPQYVIHER